MTDLCNSHSNVRGSLNSTTLCTNPRPAGFYALLSYDAENNRFRLFNKVANDYPGSTTTFSVFTTTGVVRITSEDVTVYNEPSAPYSNTVYTTLTSGLTPSSTYLGNLDCETNAKGTNRVNECLNIKNRIIFMDPRLTRDSYNFNARYINIYTIKKISRERRMVPDNNGIPNYQLRNEIVVDIPVTSAMTLGVASPRVYVFSPPSNSYPYVTECSNRGECDESSGLCYCFKGFDMDDCSRFNANAG